MSWVCAQRILSELRGCKLHLHGLRRARFLEPVTVISCCLQCIVLHGKNTVGLSLSCMGTELCTVRFWYVRDALSVMIYRANSPKPNCFYWLKNYCMYIPPCRPSTFKDRLQSANIHGEGEVKQVVAAFKTSNCCSFTEPRSVDTWRETNMSSLMWMFVKAYTTWFELAQIDSISTNLQKTPLHVDIN